MELLWPIGWHEGAPAHFRLGVGASAWHSQSLMLSTNIHLVQFTEVVSENSVRISIQLAPLELTSSILACANNFCNLSDVMRRQGYVQGKLSHIDTNARWMQSDVALALKAPAWEDKFCLEVWLRRRNQNQDQYHSLECPEVQISARSMRAHLTEELTKTKYL